MEIWISCLCIFLSILLSVFIIISCCSIREKYKKLKNVGNHTLLSKNFTAIDIKKTEDDGKSMKYKGHRYERQRKRN